ncbi:LysR family transcriptional regulator [Pseudomonas fluorescens]|uniref:LysR family transcriptional regulator n=1 Tax=Pseudomonas fluorescens TaxID=294 RepID=UPI0012418F80
MGKNKLPALNSVRAFDAAARLGRASAESLHVTQPAISRHVKILEDWLGIKIRDQERLRWCGIQGSAMRAAKREPKKCRLLLNGDVKKGKEALFIFEPPTDIQKINLSRFSPSRFSPFCGYGCCDV